MVAAACFPLGLPGSPPPRHALLSLNRLVHQPSGALPGPTEALRSPRDRWGSQLRVDQGEVQSKEETPTNPLTPPQDTPLPRRAPEEMYIQPFSRPCTLSHLSLQSLITTHPIGFRQLHYAERLLLEFWMLSTQFSDCLLAPPITASIKFPSKFTHIRRRPDSLMNEITHSLI